MLKKTLINLIILFLFTFCTSNLDDLNGIVGDHIDSKNNEGYQKEDYSIPSNAFLGHYFTSNDYKTPISSRIEKGIRHDFNSLVIDGYNKDELSAKWIGNFYFETGVYTFHIRSDKGIKVTIGNEVVIDEDGNGEIETYRVDKELDGVHKVEVEYNLDSTNTDPVDTTPSDPADTTPADSVDTTPADPVDTTPADPVDTTPADPVDTTPAEPVDTTPSDPVVEVDNDTPTVEVDWVSSEEPDPTSDSLMHPSMALNPMGWAASTIGGAGGKIIKVTNLNSSGPGSFRAAIKTAGSRIIVFEVGGIIDLAGEYLTVKSPFVTIMGQTAPSPGITLIKGTLAVRTNEVIVRHLRFRVGEGSGFNADGMSTDGSYNVIVDHCSFAWGCDENLTATGPRFEGSNVDEWRQNTSHSITFSNNIIAEGLLRSDYRNGYNSRGSLIHDNCTEITIARNIYASNWRRNPAFKGGSQGVVVNNYIYNPGNAAITYNLVSSEWSGRNYVTGEMTVIGNVLEKGPNSTTGLNFMHTNGPLNLFWEDNTVIGASANMFSGSSSHTIVNSPNIWNDNIELIKSGEVLNKLLENAGARPWDRDEVDKRIILGIKEGTNKMIDTEQEVGGYPNLTPSYQEFDPSLWGLE